MSESEQTTYGEVASFLKDLGFQDESVPGSHQAFRHKASETIILLADLKSGDPIWPRTLLPFGGT